MANTGTVVITEKDINPNSETYGQTRTRTETDTTYCPLGKNYKLKYTNSSGTGYIYCNGEPVLSKEETFSARYSTSLDIGDCVTEIGEKVCYENFGATLTTVTMTNNVTRIAEAAFDLCDALTSVTSSKSLTYIGPYAFAGCHHLASFDMPEGLTSIREMAFSGCTSFTSVTIPSTVESINYGAFNGCTGLTSVTVKAVTPPAIGSGVFTNTNNCPIYVPAGSIEAYKTASQWSNYSIRIEPIMS